MLSAAFHRRAATDSFLIAGTLASFHTPAVVAISSAHPLPDPLLEQFLPRRTHPLPHLQLNLRLELFRQLTIALKADPQFHAAASSLLLGFHPASLAGLLSSLGSHRPALSFLLIAFPSLSPHAVALSCEALLLLCSTEKRNLLAQDILSGLLLRLSPNRAAELHRWAVLRCSSRSRYQALHLILRGFLGSGMVSEALQTLAEIRRHGWTPSLSANSVLLRLLFRTGDLRNAWQLFRDLILLGPPPSIRTFNAMILGSCFKGKVAAGEGLIWLLCKYKLEPDTCSFNIIMKAQCVLGQVENAFKMFDKMLEFRCAPSIESYSILINALCRQGRMDEARLWFDRIVESGHEANAITYNVLMDGYVKSGQIDNAVSTYEEMVKNGNPPDFYTFNILVSGHCKFRRDWDELAQKLYRDAPDDEVRAHMLISNYCWNGKLEYARSMMLNNRLIPSVAAFNALIAGYSRDGLEEEAFKVYRVMVDEFGIAPTSSTWQSLLLGLCRRGRLSEAKELLHGTVERGFIVGIPAFTIYIDGCFRFGKVSEALDCLSYMEQKGFSPDVICLSAYVNGLCLCESMETAQEVFNKMCRRGLIPNNFIYNSLISGLFRAADFKEALRLEENMRCNGLRPDIFTTNIVINGFCLQRDLKRADGKLRQMGWDELCADIVTFNTLIAACYKAFDAERAERYFELMAFRDCKPDIVTYNIRIHYLCRSYKTIEAIKLLDMLVSEGLSPTTVTHNTLMNGICADSLCRAMVLAGKLIKMAFVPDVVTINLLLSHLCREGLAERALMWGEKFKKASFDFDNATLCILAKANTSEVRVASDKILFLEFLMHIAYELICNNIRSSDWKTLYVESLVGNGLYR